MNCPIVVLEEVEVKIYVLMLIRSQKHHFPRLTICMTMLNGSALVKNAIFSSKKFRKTPVVHNFSKSIVGSTGW